MNEFWTMLVGSVVYFMGILGAVQILDEVTCGHPDYHIEGLAAWPLVLGAVLWPIIMPVAGIAWVSGKSWIWWKWKRQ